MIIDLKTNPFKCSQGFYNIMPTLYGVIDPKYPEDMDLEHSELGYSVSRKRNLDILPFDYSNTYNVGLIKAHVNNLDPTQLPREIGVIAAPPKHSDVIETHYHYDSITRCASFVIYHKVIKKVRV